MRVKCPSPDRQASVEVPTSICAHYLRPAGRAAARGRIPSLSVGVQAADGLPRRRCASSTGGRDGLTFLDLAAASGLGDEVAAHRGVEPRYPDSKSRFLIQRLSGEVEITAGVEPAARGLGDRMGSSPVTKWCRARIRTEGLQGYSPRPCQTYGEVADGGGFEPPSV